jgi:hypothetical protein
MEIAFENWIAFEMEAVWGDPWIDLVYLCFSEAAACGHDGLTQTACYLCLEIGSSVLDSYFSCACCDLEIAIARHRVSFLNRCVFFFHRCGFVFC